MITKETGVILRNLRQLMKNEALVKGPLHAYIIPSGDAHQNEYIAPCDERRQYVTGFSGSAGTAVVTASKEAALWTDGRYHLQAAQQVDSNWTVMKDGIPGVLSIAEWLSDVLSPGETVVGIDGNIVSCGRWLQLKDRMAEKGLTLRNVTPNLVDMVWGDSRPAQPCNSLTMLPTSYTGVSVKEKCSIVRKKLSSMGASSIVITALDEVAWFLNLRGSDIPYNPVFYSYLIIAQDSVRWFVNESRVTQEIEEHLSEVDNLKCLPYEDFYQHLTDLGSSSVEKVWISKSSSYLVHKLVPEKRQLVHPSLLLELKATKNSTEIAGMKKAHLKDAVTLCEYFLWLEKEVPKGYLTESAAASKLVDIKKEQVDYVGLSFTTISSSGPNGAIIHYSPVEGEDELIREEALYLCDSGAHYRDGTTDVTRTVHFSVPSDYERECYTLVLKGHISLASMIFPKGVKGSQLDSFAREALWRHGLDYRHGTGHGVGHFLNVHEGPCGIRPGSTPDEVTLKEGMIITIEPGYYEAGKFGIRHENVYLVVKARPKYNFQDTGFLTFEPLTVFPFQKSLLMPSLLSNDEIKWINAYHEMCRRLLSTELVDQGRSSEILPHLDKWTSPVD